MRKNVILAAVGAVLAASIGVTIWIVSANQLPENNSAQSIRFFDKQEYRDGSYKFEWTSNAIGANSKTDINAMFTCPAQSTEVFTFLSLRGQETDPEHGWQAFTPTAFNGDTKNVLTPNLKPSGLINGTPGAKYSRDHGGDFSLGLACTHSGGKTIDSVSYRFINVVAHTGQWTALPEPTIHADSGK